MNAARCIAITVLALYAVACEQPVAPNAGVEDGPALEVTSARSPSHMAAAGTFTQTGVIAFEVTTAGPNTIIEQSSTGILSGTIAGPFVDRLKVVIHPQGNFTTHFTLSCDCTVGGKQGSLEMVVSDSGELTSPTAAEFSGRAVITAASGQLSGLHGVLDIAGTVDVASGLSTYGYTGTLRFRP